MLWILIIAVATIVFIIVISVNQKRAIDKFKYEVDRYKIDISSDVERIGAIKSSIAKYEEFKSRITSAKVKAKKLEIPMPSEPNPDCEGHEIFSSIAVLADKKAFALAGTEQLFLALLPPDQLFDSLHFAVEELGTHASQALVENISTIKSALTQGASNIHNTGVFSDCINHFGTSCYEYLQNPIHAKELAYALDHENIGKIITSFINYHTVSSGISPIIDISTHGAEIGHSWISHAHDAIGTIGSNIENGLHPDPTGHFPYITLAFSSIREIKLLSEKKTTIDSSLKNITLDAAGTGLGAAGGAKAGAVGGGIFGGPVGAIIGGTFGAIAGAMFGRSVTNEVKKGPLNDAISAYRSSFEEMQSRTKNVAVQSVNYVRSISKQERETYSNLVDSSPTIETNPILAQNETLETAMRADISSIEKQIITFKQSPYAQDEYCSKQIARIESEFHKAKKEIEASNPSILGFSSSYSPAKYIKGGAYDRELTNTLNAFHSANTKVSFVFMAWLANTANQYRQSLSRIAVAMNEKIKEYSDECDKCKVTLNAKIAMIDAEKGKLGL